MKKIVEVKFSDDDRIYFYDTNKLTLNKNDYVVIENGDILLGKVIGDPYDISDTDVNIQNGKILRIADAKDLNTNNKNIEESHKALIEARRLSEKMKLDMNIIDASFNFDRSQLLFHFLADTRVDFRELAKKLASNYHTRIELRQIGVRDKAKMVGGLGPCGRMMCCNTFLTDFNSVSINMAKNQMLALNPTKINGMCGRLLCCLGYEDDIYTEMKKGMPSIGEKYKSDGLEGKVVSLNILKKTITIETPSKSLIEVQI